MASYTTQPETSLLSRYLTWAFGKEVVALACSPLFGGVHRNWRVTAQVEGEVCDFVLRQMPPVETLGFARQEVVPYDLTTEFAVLRELQKTALIAPRAWGFDQKGEFFEAPTFVMEFIEGPTLLEAVEAEPQVVARRFVETIVTMNRVSPQAVPSIAMQHGDSVGLVSWLVEQSREIALPDDFKSGLEVLDNAPGKLPGSAFGNGDLNPQNFIVQADGSIAIVDWEYAGFNDPLTEIMLFHTWPKESPFLCTYPIDKMYCQATGLDTDLLPWYELQAALSSWLYAAKDGQKDVMELREGWIKRLLP